MLEHLKKHASIYFALSLIIVTFSVIANLKKDAYWDEIVFLRGASSLSNNLLPIYLSEGNTAGGAWYPSIYFFVIKFIASKFTAIEYGIRLFNCLCFFGTIFFTFKSARIVLASTIWSYICVCFFVTTPMVLQGVLLIEIDTSLLALAVSYSLYSILNSVTKSDKIQTNTEIIAYALIALSKIFFLPLIVITVFFCKILIDRKPSSFLRSLINLILSLLIVFIIWISVCYLNHSDPSYFIKFIKARATSQTIFTASHFAEIIKGLVRKAIWLNPAYLTLICISLFVFIRTAIVRRSINIAEAIVFLLFSISFLFYAFIGLDAAGYPKYLYPILGAAFYNVNLFASESLSDNCGCG